MGSYYITLLAILFFEDIIKFDLHHMPSYNGFVPQ